MSYWNTSNFKHPRHSKSVVPCWTLISCAMQQTWTRYITIYHNTIRYLTSWPAWTHTVCCRAFGTACQKSTLKRLGTSRQWFQVNFESWNWKCWNWSISSKWFPECKEIQFYSYRGLPVTLTYFDPVPWILAATRLIAVTDAHQKYSKVLLHWCFLFGEATWSN